MNENDRKKLNSAFGDIDDSFINEAARPIKAQRRKTVSRLASICALMALVLIPAVYVLVQGLPSPVGPPTGGVQGTPSITTSETSSPNNLDESHLPNELQTEPVQTEPPQTVHSPNEYTPPPLKAPTVTVTSHGKTVEPIGSLQGAMFESQVNEEVIAMDEEQFPSVIEIMQSRFDFIPSLNYNENDIAISTDGGRVVDISVYESLDTSIHTPQFALVGHVEELSVLNAYEGFWYVAVEIEHSYEEDGWLVTVNHVYIFGIYVPYYGETLPPMPEPESSEQILLPDLPTGSLYGDLTVFSGDTEYISKPCMVYISMYENGYWLNGDGVGIDYYIANEPDSIPSVDYSPNLSLILEGNATVEGISLFSLDLETRINITQLSTIHDHPGEWYLVINVSYLGENIDDPVLGGNERSNFDHIVRLVVPHLGGEVAVSDGFQTVTAYSLFVSGLLYDSELDVFVEIDGAYSLDIIEHIAADLNTFSIYRGREIGYRIPINSNLISITVLDSNFNELAISDEIGGNFVLLSELEEGEYYVSLLVYHMGQMFPQHGTTEDKYTEEIFKFEITPPPSE